MEKRICSADLGFCKNAGHTGSIELTWEDDKVVDVKCGFGDFKTCKYVDECELYQRHPIGFVQTYPQKDQ